MYPKSGMCKCIVFSSYTFDSAINNKIFLHILFNTYQLVSELYQKVLIERETREKSVRETREKSVKRDGRKYQQW